MKDADRDKIHFWVDAMFCKGYFAAVDKKLSMLDLDSEEVEVILTWVTATFCAKSKLKNRAVLFEYLRDNHEEGIWKGLE